MPPVTQINLFSIKPGKTDEFIEAQKRYAATTSLPKGVVDSRMYRSLDGETIARVTLYDSIEAHGEVQRNEGLRRHIEALIPLVESSSPALYEEVDLPGNSNSLQVVPG
jgi:hypothetical protein